MELVTQAAGSPPTQRAAQRYVCGKLRPAFLALVLALAGCDLRPAAEVVPAPAAADAGARDAGEREAAAPDLARGELLSLACQACHTLRTAEAHPNGPSLRGIFGREAGTRPGFAYSEALRAADLVWTPAALEAWLADPAGFLPGNNMAFTGYRSERDRRDLIAFLVHATAPAVAE